MSAQAFWMVVTGRVEKVILAPIRVNSSGMRMYRQRMRTAFSAWRMFSSGSSFCRQSERTGFLWVGRKN